MLVLQWKCQDCDHLTSPVPVPFDYQQPFPRVHLYCVDCARVLSHDALVHDVESIAPFTVGHALARAAAEEAAERAVGAL